MLKVVGEFNKLSDEMLATVKPLKHGQRATFRLLNGQKDPMTGQLYFGATRTINCRDRILDIGTDQPVEIGVVTEITPDNKVKKWLKYVLDGGGPNSLVGEKFELHGDRLRDRELYYFLCLSNLRANNPYRDSSVTPLYELVDEDAEAQRRGYHRSDVLKALMKSEGMTHGEYVLFAAGMGWDETIQPSLLKEKVCDYAFKHPKEFLAKVDDGIQAIKSILKIATTKSVIAFDPIRYQYKWAESGSVIAKLERDEDKDELTLMAEWIVHSKNGFHVFEKIKTTYNAVVDREKNGVEEPTVTQEEPGAFGEEDIATPDPEPTPEPVKTVEPKKTKAGKSEKGSKGKKANPIEEAIQDSAFEPGASEPEASDPGELVL